MLLPRSVRSCISHVNNLLVDDFAFRSKGSSTLFITFAGMAGILKTLAALKQRLGIETRPFEFVHSLQEKQCDVVYLRDRHRAYYHFGVKGVGRNVSEVAKVLNDLISQRKYDLVVTLGHSMGGYASMLFASKIKADICIAISAPTFLDPENREKYGDNRYAHEKSRLYWSKHQSSGYFDLQRYFQSKAQAKTERACTYCLFYGENDRLDRIHATRMIGLNQPFHVFEVKDGGHNTARQMRDSGLLFRLFDNILLLSDRKEVSRVLKSIEVEASVRVPLSSSYPLRSTGISL